MHEKPGIQSGRGRGSVDVERTVRSAEDIGRLLRDRRRQQGLTQGELAELTDTHRNRIAEIEQGRPTERVALILRTLNELGLEVVVRSRNIHRGERS